MPQTKTRYALTLSLNSLGLPNVPEEKYRPRYLKEDIRLASVSITIFLGVIGLFIFRDYQLSGSSTTFFALAALRLAMLTIGFFIIRYLNKVADFRIFDKLVFFALLAGVTGFLIINATRPADYTAYLLIDLAAISAMYLAVPQKLSNQTFLGMYIMAGDILILILTKDASLRSQLFTIIPAFGLVNVVGFGLSRRLHASRCRECVAMEAQESILAEKQRMEHELHNSEKLEAIGQAAGGVGHDFNNIFTAILGNVSLAKSLAPPGGEIEQVLAEAEKATLRAKDLNQRMITFSGGGQPVKQPVYIVDLVRDTVKSTFEGSKIEAKVTIPEILMAEIDPAQIRQALKNILVNARDAMQDGGAVRIAARSIDNAEVSRRGLAGLLKNDHYIVLDINDNGPGVADSDRDKIFQPFYTTKTGASGLGLAVAYSIFKSHGGYLTLCHNGSRGACFSMYLPAGITSPEIKETDNRTAKHSRILVMDDEEGIRKVAGKMLLRLGYDVETAVDGCEAVETYREALRSGPRFDAVILDLTVPRNMGGLETIAILRGVDPGVKAIVSSGYTDDPALANYLELGFAGAVHKPYTMEQLGQALKQILE